MQNDTQNIIGVDVGSGSVRAGVFNLRGELLAHATREITLFRSAGNKVSSRAVRSGRRCATALKRRWPAPAFRRRR